MEEDINWPLLFLMGIVFDLSDFLGGSVPVVGDFFDILETGLFYTLSRDSVALAPLIEVVPMLDIIPSYTLAALYLYFRRERS